MTAGKKRVSDTETKGCLIQITQIRKTSNIGNFANIICVMCKFKINKLENKTKIQLSTRTQGHLNKDHIPNIIVTIFKFQWELVGPLAFFF